MATKKKEGNLATIISGIVFLAIAGVLFYVTFTLRSAAQGRELKVSLAELYTQNATYGDYLTVEDTGAVVSSASDISDEMGQPIGRAFILNSIPNYIFMIGIADQMTDTLGNAVPQVLPGTLLPRAFYCRVNTEGDTPPMGAENFAVQNGLNSGAQFYMVQVGVTKGDTSVPFYMTMGFGIIAVFFSLGSWWSMMRKK